MKICPFCECDLEEVVPGEWHCPECGETFVDKGFDYPVSESESMTDTDYDEDDEW